MEPGGNHGAQTSRGAASVGDLSFSDVGSFCPAGDAYSEYQNAIGQLQGDSGGGAAVGRGANILLCYKVQLVVRTGCQSHYS